MRANFKLNILVFDNQIFNNQIVNNQKYIEILIGQEVCSSAFAIMLSRELQLQRNYKYLDD